MKIAVTLDPAWTTRWHAAVVADLDALAGVEAVTLHALAGEPPPAGLGVLIAFEGLLRRRRDDHPALPAPLPRPPDPRAPMADLVVDLTGRYGGPDPALSIGCDGAGIMAGGLAALCDGGTPGLELHRVGKDRRLAGRWAVAVEDRTQLLAGLDGLLGRARQILRLAVGQTVAGSPLRLPSGQGEAGLLRRPSTAGAARLLVDGLAARIAARLDRLARRSQDWRVAWRPASEAAGLPTATGSAFTLLPDDGRRFYADPFVWRRDGRTALFVEEFPYATGKGVISVALLGPRGPVGPPRPILEESCHLSYPHLLEWDGALYMIPETSGRRSVELWRCLQFPDRFERVAVLIADADLSDATLFRAEGAFHLLAASREPWCSSWDGLDHWSAPDLLGPWRRVGEGPAGIDVGRLRPGGAVFEAGGRLVRPVQDSSRRYGGRLGFVEMAFDGGGLQERSVGRLDPPAPFQGLHSFNRAAGFEVIDLFGPSTAADAGVRPRMGDEAEWQGIGRLTD